MNEIGYAITSFITFQIDPPINLQVIKLEWIK